MPKSRNRAKVAHPDNPERKDRMNRKMREYRKNHNRRAKHSTPIYVENPEILEKIGMDEE